MKITKIEPQKRRPQRRSVWVDGKFYCGVSEEVLLRAGLREEQTVTEEELFELTKGEERRKAKEYALNLLGYRMRSEKELKDRLERKGYDKDVIRDVSEDLRRVDLINDLEFARAWVRNRMETNPKGPYALRTELWKKGVAKETVDQVIDEFSSTYDEVETALKLAGRRFGNHPDLTDPAIRRRLLGFLTRRGFSYDTCGTVMEKMKG